METNRIEKKPQYRKAPLSTEAEQALERMVKATNQGFTGGKIGKAEVLSWLILRFEMSSFDDAKEEIRMAYFDKVAYLSAVVEEMKSSLKRAVPIPTGPNC